MKNGITVKPEKQKMFNDKELKTVDETFKVGDGVTVHGYTDSRAFTVIDISASGKSMEIQRCKVTLLNGNNSGQPDALIFHPGGFMDHVTGIQRWDIEPDFDGTILKVRIHNDGKWYSQQGKVTFGAEEFYDYNF